MQHKNREVESQHCIYETNVKLCVSYTQLKNLRGCKNQLIDKCNQMANKNMKKSATSLIIRKL